jgi:hypothetical protein
MEKKKIPGIQLIELFLVKADWGRTFMGEIRRDFDNNGNEIVFGRVIINEGRAYSRAANQKELMKQMNDICIMKLDMGLHFDVGVTSQIFGENFFLN